MASRMAQVAQFVLDNASTFVGTPMTMGKRELERTVERDLDLSGWLDTVGVEFSDDVAECSMQLASVQVGNFEVNARGDRVARLRIRAQVSWPSWGMGDPEICMRRLALMQQTVAFARAVEMQFPGEYEVVVATAEEVAAAEAAKAEANIRAKAREYLAVAAKGLRVNCYVTRSEDLLSSDGEMEVTVGKKTYLIEQEGSTVTITRRA